LNAGPIRNDFVWSIALHNLGLRRTCPVIPWTIKRSDTTDYILKITDNAIRFLTNNGITLIKEHDVHILNKFDLEKNIKIELGINE
jgi:hypothetical protein